MQVGNSKIWKKHLYDGDASMLCRQFQMKTRVIQKPLTYLKFKGNILEQMSWFPKVQILTNRNQNQPVESCQNKLAWHFYVSKDP